MANQVLNYHDAVIYDTDVGLFGDGGWLNDNCINWFFRVLEHEVFPGRKEFLFMDPAVVSCMMNQCDDQEEFTDLGRGLDLASRSMVFVPVNDAVGRMSRGSHWSLLVFESSSGGGGSSTRRFRHFDSSQGSNRTPADRTAAKFSLMLEETAVGKGGQPRVEHVHEAPQQRNGFDCGMYTVLLAERLASKATAAATPTPLLMEVEAGAGPGSASVPRENQPPLQDKEAVLAAGGRASVGSGGGIGGGSDGDGGARDGVSRVAAGTGSGDAAAADAATIMISPEFVSNARNLAMDRLLGCIRNQG